MRRWKRRRDTKLGEGGFGAVFRHERTDGVKVAVKRLSRRKKRLSRHRADALRREAEIAAKLDHPNIVKLLEFDLEKTGNLSLTMELVDGVDLAQLLRVTGVPVAAGVHIIRSVLDALAYAHDVGRIVHRDISPHNILIAWDGTVKLSDFGIAVSLEDDDDESDDGTGNPARKNLGKVRYMSPEQYGGCGVDERSDLFSVGVVLSLLLTGAHYASSRSGIVSVLSGRTEIQPITDRFPELPGPLAPLVDRLLADDPAARYPSARATLQAVPAWSHGREQLVSHLAQLRKAGVFESRGDHSRGRRWRPVAVASVAFLITGLLGGAAADRLLAGDEPGAVERRARDTHQPGDEPPLIENGPDVAIICDTPAPHPGPDYIVAAVESLEDVSDGEPPPAERNRPTRHIRRKRPGSDRHQRVDLSHLGQPISGRFVIDMPDAP